MGLIIIFISQLNPTLGFVRLNVFLLNMGGDHNRSNAGQSITKENMVKENKVDQEGVEKNPANAERHETRNS